MTVEWQAPGALASVGKDASTVRDVEGIPEGLDAQRRARCLGIVGDAITVNCEPQMNGVGLPETLDVKSIGANAADLLDDARLEFEDLAPGLDTPREIARWSSAFQTAGMKRTLTLRPYWLVDS